MNPLHQYSLTIDSYTPGLLQSFEETLTREIRLQQRYRSSAIDALIPSQESCIVKLKRLRVPDALPSRLETLHDFSMTLQCEDRQIYYKGCEFASLTLRADSSGTMLEEATVYVKTRSVNAE